MQTYLRWFLYLLIASIGIGAVAGVVIVFRGNWSWFEVRVLLTAAAIALGSLGAMACAASLAGQRARAVPMTGLAIVPLGVALSLLGMWAEFQSEDFWKLTASILAVAFACVVVSVLTLAQLAPQYRWAFVTAQAIIFAETGLIVITILLEPADDGLIRAMAAGAIVAAAATIVVPILAVLSRRQLAATDDSGLDAEIATLRARLAELEARRAAAAGVGETDVTDNDPPESPA